MYRKPIGWLCSRFLGIRERLTYDNLVVMANSKDERWLSVIEVARALGVSRMAVYKAIAEGRLKSHKMVLSRRVLRINAQEVKEFRVSKSHQHRGKRQMPRSRRSRRVVATSQPRRHVSISVK